MKFNSPLFDRIRMKPDEERRRRHTLPACEWPDCSKPATHRAPKGRGREGEYWRYCLDHVRTYNQSYNYFAGMADDAVQAFQKDAVTGHRPTWRMGTHGGKPAEAGLGTSEWQDPFQLFEQLGGVGGSSPQQHEVRPVHRAERKALHVLGLEIEATKQEIRSRFKELVKRHHPDVNGGDRSTEDRLRDIIQAYNYLKSVGFC